MIIPEASPPTSLSSVKRASTFLTVLWTPMGDTTGHVIFYNEHNTTNTYSEGCPNSWNEINVIGGGGIYDISGLTPNVSYNICITGTSEHFNSDCKCLRKCRVLCIPYTTKLSSTIVAQCLALECSFYQTASDNFKCIYLLLLFVSLPNSKNICEMCYNF